MYASYDPYVKDSDDWLAKVAQVSLFFSLVSSIALKMESDSSTEALGNVLIVTLMVPPVAAFLFESDLDFEADCHVSFVKEKAIKCFTSTLGRCFDKVLGGDIKVMVPEGDIKVVVPKTGDDTPAPTPPGRTPEPTSGAELEVGVGVHPGAESCTALPQQPLRGRPALRHQR